jgi:hypothetical protein
MWKLNSSQPAKQLLFTGPTGFYQWSESPETLIWKIDQNIYVFLNCNKTITACNSDAARFTLPYLGNKYELIIG